jgi:hypothetical protein
MEFDNIDVRNFPLELRVCFYLLNWNKYISINSVDEWIDYAIPYYFPNEGKEQAKRWTREEFNRLYDFIVRYIV